MRHDMGATWVKRLTRRDALGWMGSSAAAAAVLVACGGDKSPTASPATSTTSTTAGSSGTTTTARPISCVLTPEMTEGPYYISGEAMRSDVTEGKSGVPLQLDLTVADASTCAVIPGAGVEIWHADATGNYSGFGSSVANRTFLRGVQTADQSGKVVFHTIYPGWYQGRATHIHLKVHLDGATHTTQLFFDEQTNNAVYARAPYNTHPGPRTLNAQDGIYSGGGSTTTVTPSPIGSGYAGALTLGVRR